MRVFVTGGTGFVGKPTVRRLVEGGHRVRCLVRRTSNTGDLEELGCEFAYGDVTDKASLVEGMRDCDWLVHLANVYSFWEADKSVYRRINVEGTRNVMEAALEEGISKVAHVSTFLVWGKPAQSPFDEETPVGPERFTEYAQCKYEGDLLVWELYRERGLPVVVLYPGGVLGAGNPKSNGRYIRDLVEGRMPGMVFENSALTWVYVKDVAEAIVRALEKEGNVGEEYLVGRYALAMGELTRIVCEISGAPLPKMSVPDRVVMAGAMLLTKVADLSGRPPLLGMSADTMRNIKEGTVFDGSKAERELGITYTPIRQAIEEEVAFLQR
ncbi:MAG: NAD-dependent epimerase/dehydratase family protein [Chloroflexota bacterium]|jgi:dihydroflavonol-4-reductase|nr:NAD-dependent epimerase/dehydratase family protein [Chloroflexota bacterium]